MANALRLTRHTAVMLLFLTWRESAPCGALTVDPPEQLAVRDPGHLGRLEITWSPPASLVNRTECPRLYHLEYFDTYEDSWAAVRTERTTYSAQFDLTKDVRVRVSTLLSGPCTDGTPIMSAGYAELVQKPPGTGVPGTAVQDFICVYHNMKYLECSWGRSPTTPANSQQSLYFWHKDLEQAQECPKYLTSGGARTGCSFTGTSLPDLTDINFCVNGSSPKGPLKPAYVSLQIQDHVKPGVAEELHLRAGPDELELHWDGPAGKVPGHCLEWEVEHNQERPGGQTKSEQILTKQTSLTLPSDLDNDRHCFRVRSKLHKYCAENSFWSEWSRPTCHPVAEQKPVAPEPVWDVVPAYVYVAVAIMAVLVLSLCVWVALSVRRSRQVKEPDSLLAALFARSPVMEA